MISISELRLGNTVKCKTSNDGGCYKVLSLDGWNLKCTLDGIRQDEWQSR